MITRLGAVVALLVAAWLSDADLSRWVAVQLARACWPFELPAAAVAAEARSWAAWEAAAAAAAAAADADAGGGGGARDATPPLAAPVHELRALLDGAETLDLTRPARVRGALALARGADGGGAGAAAAPWNLTTLSRAPLGDVVVDYFADATATPAEGGLVPRARAPLREVLRRAAAGEPVKVGSEAPLRRHTLPGGLPILER